jgi:hypothetical protein
MRMKWKLPVYFSALVLGLTATVVSCSKDSTAPQGSASTAAHPTQQKTSDSQDSYKRAGKYHTDGLAYVYAKLAQTNKRSSKAEKCRVAIAALKEFDKSFRKDARSTGVISDDVCGPVGATDIPQSGEQSAPSYAGAGFSPLAASMLSEIGNVTNSHSSSASVVSAVTRVQNSAAAKLNPSEAGAVAALGSVAISSAEYWEANADKWRGLSSAPGEIRKQIITTGTDGAKSGGLLARPRASISPCCGGIATADITAFISALLQGWFAGIFDLEQAAMRATVASIVAGLRSLL